MISVQIWAESKKFIITDASGASRGAKSVTFMGLPFNRPLPQQAERVERLADYMIGWAGVLDCQRANFDSVLEQIHEVIASAQLPADAVRVFEHNTKAMHFVALFNPARHDKTRPVITLHLRGCSCIHEEYAETSFRGWGKWHSIEADTVDEAIAIELNKTCHWTVKRDANDIRRCTCLTPPAEYVPRETEIADADIPY
jgi:hypothetical protein